jgi:hypothetical protein
MRKLLLSGAAFGVLGMPAMAADVAPAYKIPVPVPVFSWSGCYVGGDVGGAWGSQGVLNTSPVAFAFPPVVLSQAPANTTVTGGSVIGGGHLGCNLQWTPFLVIGVEGDFMGAGLNATGHAESLFGGVAAPRSGITWSSRLDSIGDGTRTCWLGVDAEHARVFDRWRCLGSDQPLVDRRLFLRLSGLRDHLFQQHEFGLCSRRWPGMGAVEQQLDRQGRIPLLQSHRCDRGRVRGRSTDRRGQPHLEQHGGFIGSPRPELQVLTVFSARWVVAGFAGRQCAGAAEKC